MATIEDAKRISDLLSVDENVVSPERLLVGIKVELEHGCVDSGTDVTSDDLVQTAKIALAHFKENPGSSKYGDYYHHLAKMEKASDKYWKGKDKPDIFISRERAESITSGKQLFPSGCQHTMPFWDLIDLMRQDL